MLFCQPKTRLSSVAWNFQGTSMVTSTEISEVIARTAFGLTMGLFMISKPSYLAIVSAG